MVGVKNSMKFKNIEFLRFVFASIIVYCHLGLLTSTFQQIPSYFHVSLGMFFAQNAVDFFFILSGFLFAFTFELNRDINVFDFLKKKVIRLWPVLAFSIVGYICLAIINVSSYGTNIYNYLYGLIFLDNIGVTKVHVGPSWYVSSLVFVSLFYFYLYKTCSVKVANLITGILTWFSYAYMINYDDGFIKNYIVTDNNVFNMGLMRGLGGMGLGIFLCNTYQYYKDKINPNKLICSAFELVIFYWIIFNLFFYNFYIKNVMIFIVLFVVLIWLFLNKKGYISQFFDSNISVWLGKISYSLFLTHLLVIYTIKTFWWNQSNVLILKYPNLVLAGIFLISIIFAVLVRILIEKPQNKLFCKLGYLKYYLFVFTTMLLIFTGIHCFVL